MLRLVNRSSLRTLTPRIPNPSPPVRSDSGTAKGKGKLKDGQQLKRSTVTTKKKATGGEGGRGHGKHEQIELLARMVGSSVNAPTPVRYLTAKEREREKLGLISKERKREIDLAKKRKLEPDSVIMGTPGLDLISLRLVDADKIPKYELTV